MIGLAIKLSISLGLHRRRRSAILSLDTELDKRLFWTCYCLDRDINLTMGRPPSIADSDIDNEVCWKPQQYPWRHIDHDCDSYRSMSTRIATLKESSNVLSTVVLES
jgi:hypothetical protein